MKVKALLYNMVQKHLPQSNFKVQSRVKVKALLCSYDDKFTLIFTLGMWPFGQTFAMAPEDWVVDGRQLP